MKRKLCALLLTVLAGSLAFSVVGQRRRRPVARPPVASDRGYVAVRFRQIADEYLKGHYSFNPTEATAAGLHESDSRLEGRSRAGLEAEARRLRDTLSLLSRINPNSLPEDARYDYLVLTSHARGRLLDLQDLRRWQRDPNAYNQVAAAGVDNILKRNYAGFDQRLDAVLAREREIARLLDEARANLEAPPRIYTEMALAQLRGSLDYFSRVV